MFLQNLRNFLANACFHRHSGSNDFLPAISKRPLQAGQYRFSAQQKIRGKRQEQDALVIDLRAVHEDRLDPLGLTILVMPQGFSRLQALRDHASQRVTFFPLKLQQVFQGT